MKEERRKGERRMEGRKVFLNIYNVPKRGEWEGEKKCLLTKNKNKKTIKSRSSFKSNSLPITPHCLRKGSEANA